MNIQSMVQDTADSIRRFKMKINSVPVDDYITLAKTMLREVQRIRLATKIPEKNLGFLKHHLKSFKHRLTYNQLTTNF